MKTLTADEIFKVKDIKIEPVDVPEWGGRVFVRQFSAKVREEFDSLLVGDGEGDELDTENLRCRVVALACCDEKGKLLFTVEQAALLAEKSNDAIDRVYDKAAALNKLRKKDVEIEKKESATPPTADSPTA
jgi:hypothetical protein